MSADEPPTYDAQLKGEGGASTAAAAEPAAGSPFTIRVDLVDPQTGLPRKVR